MLAILPLGAVEAHGPHLPLITDGVISGAMARVAAERLLLGGWQPLLLPPIDYSAAPFAAGFAGTISVRPETVTALIVDIGRSLAERGVRVLAIANAHLDPAHLGSIDAAVTALEGTLEVVFPNLTRRPWGGRLTEEFKSGACHAGQFESSIVLAERPEWVRDEVRSELTANPVSLSEAILAGKNSFETAGGPEAYFGDPARATAREGTETIDTLAGILVDAVSQVVGDSSPAGGTSG